MLTKFLCNNICIKKWNFKENIGLLTKHIERHNALMIIVSSIISLVAFGHARYQEGMEIS